MSGYAGVPACFQGGAVSRPHHRLDIRRTEDDGVVGFYALYGGVVVAVACAVLVVVGEGGGGFAGDKGEEQKEEEEDGGGYQIFCKLYCCFVVECGLKPSVPSRPLTPSPPFPDMSG